MTQLSKALIDALDKAKALPYTRHRSRHFAKLLDKRGRVVVEAPNSYNKTHPEFQRVAESIGLGVKCYQHAEFSVINRDRLKRGYRLVVGRVDVDGNPVNSMPCPVCMEFIKLHGNIKIIEWS